MKQRYTYYRLENGIYYAIDILTKKRQSLNTTTPEEACRLLGTLNEACKQPAINLQIAQVYLQHSDPDYAKRTWRLVMDRLGEMKTSNTLKRWNVAVKDRRQRQMLKDSTVRDRRQKSCAKCCRERCRALARHAAPGKTEYPRKVGLCWNHRQAYQNST